MGKSSGRGRGTGRAGASLYAADDPKAVREADRKRRETLCYVVLDSA